jgi:hypothetical protein
MGFMKSLPAACLFSGCSFAVSMPSQNAFGMTSSVTGGFSSQKRHPERTESAVTGFSPLRTVFRLLFLVRFRQEP